MRLLTLIALVLVACASDPLIGEWRAVIDDADVTYEFREDGTMTITRSTPFGYEHMLDAEYSSDGSMITVNHPDLGISSVNYRIEGQKLILFEENRETTFIRD